MKQLGLAAAVVMALGSMSAVAAADEVPRRPVAAAARQQKPIVLEPVPIVGRHQRPIAAVEVARTRPQLGIRDLKRNLLDRIETATEKDPF